jgi:elongation factor Ts
MSFKDQVSELRVRTGAGMSACTQALKETNGNIEEAIVALRKRGEARADGLSNRQTKAFGYGNYLHHNRTAAVLVRMSCETDFVVRTSEFLELADGIAMHIMAYKPSVIALADLSESVIQMERDIAKSELEGRGMTGDRLEKALKGKLDKVLAEKCLLEQPYVTNPTITVGQAVKELSAKCGENIVIEKFIYVN